MLRCCCDELAEFAGKHNAIDARIVEIVAELDRDELCSATGARSIAALVAWKMGSSAANPAIATVAHRLEDFPRCAAGMREGGLSLDESVVIAAQACRRNPMPIMPGAGEQSRDGQPGCAPR